MPQEKYLFNYSKVTLLALAFLYFVMPVALQYVVGDEFYIFSKYQFQVSARSIIFYVVLAIFLFLLIRNTQKEVGMFKRLPSKNIFKIIFFFNLLYLSIILIRGILYRRQGASREELLGIISSQLIPGYGYLLLLACISIVHLKSKVNLFLFILIAFAVDIIYQGKIFATVALMLSMFFIDSINFKFSYLRILIFGAGGFGFLMIIFIVRALSADGQDSDLTSVYTSFSEFMGVHATTGWAYGYHLAKLPMALTDFDMALRTYYVSSVGHGLALSPVAYFTGNFGDWYLVFAVLYFIIVYLIFYFSSKIIGRFSIFVLAYNFIHLLRHGPNVFLHNCILQLMFLIIITFFIKSFSSEKIAKDESKNNENWNRL
jgi:hypothetical protein